MNSAERWNEGETVGLMSIRPFLFYVSVPSALSLSHIPPSSHRDLGYFCAQDFLPASWQTISRKEIVKHLKQAVKFVALCPRDRRAWGGGGRSGCGRCGSRGQVQSAAGGDTNSELPRVGPLVLTTQPSTILWSNITITTKLILLIKQH